MNSRPNPRTLAATFLLVSATGSIAVLAARNLYDDEISSLDRITSPVANIIRTTAAGDIHPPGMYLMAHLAYRILPSFRWMNLLPCLFLYVGLTVFLLQIAPLFTCTRSQLCLLLLATLHPQLLVWSTTFRWYSWWTGLALITLTTALQPGILKPIFGPIRALMLGLLLASLFYLNYITFLFAFALGAVILLRYRAQPGKRLFAPALLAIGVFAALIAPQLRTLLAVQLPYSQDQRSGLAASSLRLLQSVAMSEAYLPWHPLAILAALLCSVLCVSGLIAQLRLYRSRRNSEALHGDLPQRDPALDSIFLFGLLFFLLVVFTGLGGNPRNGLLLIPVLAPAAALIVGTLQPRTQDAILLFVALWSIVGIAHLLGRHGLTKATMNDRPEQVVAFIRQATGPGCAVVATYDTGLAFSLAQANLPHLLILTPFDNAVLGSASYLSSSDCTHTRLYAVRSYQGKISPWTRTLSDELQSSMQFVQVQPSVDSFSFDPDAARKRSLSRIAGLHGDLASAAQLPDYRYVVTSGAIDPANLEVIRKSLPDFLNGADSGANDGRVKP
jgi:hypothetical protein